MFLHISVLYYFSMSREVRALIILSLGVVYFMIPVGGLLFFTSQKVWMKLAKANEIIRKAVGETSGSEMR
ncbi:MAG: hypothetical protein E3K32_01625 [wastewater metagenome]|nr:hypothetical protein [Candidatus Loosdrechtia aerotolerans]